MSHSRIPIHDFSKDDSTSIPFKILPLERRNEYDDREAHRHNYYEIFIFEKGGGTHRIDFDEIPIHDKCLHFVSPGQVHLVKRELDSYGLVILFSRDFYYLNLQNKDILFEIPFLNNNIARPVLEPDESSFAVIKTVIDQIRNEYETSGAMREDILRALLNVLLIHCTRAYDLQSAASGSSDRSAARLFQQFRILLEKNFSGQHKVSEYASQLAITEKYLNEICKKAVGQTASTVIQDRIILEAKRLLFHSDLSGKEIAYFLHFEDPSHFGKFFRNKTGISPGEFREQMQGNNPTAATI